MAILFGKPALLMTKLLSSFLEMDRWLLENDDMCMLFELLIDATPFPFRVYLAMPKAELVITPEDSDDCNSCLAFCMAFLSASLRDCVVRICCSQFDPYMMTLSPLTDILLWAGLIVWYDWLSNLWFEDLRNLRLPVALSQFRWCDCERIRTCVDQMSIIELQMTHLDVAICGTGRKRLVSDQDHGSLILRTDYSLEIWHPHNVIRHTSNRVWSIVLRIYVMQLFQLAIIIELFLACELKWSDR